MAKTRLPYPPQFRRQMVELVAKFEPTAQSIRNWVAQSARNAGRGDGGLTTAEREELNRLRRENRQLRVERKIHSKAAAWFARETNAHGTSHGTYGAPRVHAELAAKATRIGRKRVARLMSRAGLAGVSRRKYVVTTVKGDSRQAPDLVGRTFAAGAPDLLWVADITYIPTWAGFLYLAVVLDGYNWCLTL